MTKLRGDKPKAMPWEKDGGKDLGRTDLSKSGFYNTRRWRKIRNHVISKQPLCVMCLEEGKYTPAYLVDHIIPIDENSSEELKYGEENLQPLCVSHHILKTKQDNSKFSQGNKINGKKLMDDLEN